jgi:hypothetical protein
LPKNEEKEAKKKKNRHFLKKTVFEKVINSVKNQWNSDKN